jgi:hypothetical protein
LNARRQRLGESGEPVELPLETLELGATNGTVHAEATVQANVQPSEVTP